MEKINLVEILKDCPYGMELYSPLCGDCKLYDVNDYSIRIETPNKDTLISLHHDGRYCSGGEIMIFPKGKTTWKNFVPQCKFKNGDIIFTCTSDYVWVSIFKQFSGNLCCTYVDLCINDDDLIINTCCLCDIEDINIQRLATEQEKQKLFNVIKANGYKWNEETKILEKLVKPRFKVGDRITTIYGDFQYDIKELTDTHYTLVEVEHKFQYTEPISEDKNWELVPNKFDITTLKPFDKVLVRDNDEQLWTADMFSFYNEKQAYPFMCVGHYTKQCIPYEGNEHLLGTTNDCDEYFKTWK